MHYITHGPPCPEVEQTPFPLLSHGAVLPMSHMSGCGGLAAQDNTGHLLDEPEARYEKKIHHLHQRESSGRAFLQTKNAMIWVLPGGEGGYSEDSGVTRIFNPASGHFYYICITEGFVLSG